jgi:hypothetical protein
MSEVEEVPDPPGGLGVRGSRVWIELQRVGGPFEPNDAEMVLEACRTLDVIEQLAAAVDADGLFTTGSQGQRVMNPALAELRQQQAAFGKLLAGVSLPEREKAADLFHHRRAKAGATARWERPVAQPVRRLRGGQTTAQARWEALVADSEREPASERWARLSGEERQADDV